MLAMPSGNEEEAKFRNLDSNRHEVRDAGWSHYLLLDK
jgi:hypothetical protein